MQDKPEELGGKSFIELVQQSSATGPLRNSPLVMKALIQDSPDNMCMGDTLAADFFFMLWAVKRHPEAIEKAAQSLKDDEAFMKEVADMKAADSDKKEDAA